MKRVFNFSAGPAALPEPVLTQVRDELMDWHGQGLSVMEMSHRGAAFTEIAQKANAALRRLLSIDDDYEVLFLQGGATLQFSAVVLNLAAPADVVDYVNTGAWSKKAIAEAQRFAQVKVVADAVDNNYTGIPDTATWEPSTNAAYLHFCLNETIGGVEFFTQPKVSSAPLVADASSTLLSRPLPIREFGLIYAGAQKNIGPAGITIVIVRKDLLGKARSDIPHLLSYQVMAETHSMSNTPATFPWYVAGLVFEWIEQKGGLTAIESYNRTKADTLYSAIDRSDFYSNPVATHCRSRMNVPFVLARPELDKLFLEQAEERGLAHLKGHRSVGGMRASLYNAMTQEGVESLVSFMDAFEKEHG